MTSRAKGVLTFFVLALIAGLGTLYLIFHTLYVRPVAPEVGTSEELAARIEPLMTANPAALMVVTVRDTGDFVQLTPAGAGLRLSFPVATDRQRELAPTMRKALKGLGCVVEDVSAGDVAFVEADLLGDAPSVARMVKTILREAFGTGTQTALVFDHAGLDD